MTSSSLLCACHRHPEPSNTRMPHNHTSSVNSHLKRVAARPLRGGSSLATVYSPPPCENNMPTPQSQFTNRRSLEEGRSQAAARWRFPRHCVLALGVLDRIVVPK
eukprot:364301-Chlamydomonas_euryale.AAC.4